MTWSLFTPQRITVTGPGGDAPTIVRGSVMVDPSALPNNLGRATTTITVTGATFADTVTGVSFSEDLKGLGLRGWIRAADTVTVEFSNDSTAPIEIGSGTLRVAVTKSE